MPANHASKRTTLTDHAIQLAPGAPSNKHLSRLSKHQLCDLALTWLGDTPRSTGTAQDDSDDEADDDLLEETSSRRALYQQLKDEQGNAKTAVIRAIQQDWANGLTYRQVAQLDIQLFQEKGTGRSWTAFQAASTSPATSIADSSQLFERFRVAFGAYHSHYLQLATLPAPHALTILRIQLLPPSTSTSRTTSHPAPIFLLHLPLTPYLLLPSSLSSTYAPIVRQCLVGAISTPPAQGLDEVQLRGKDWRGLREMLLRRGASVGRWRALRDGKQEVDGGGVLVPKERRRRPAVDPVEEAENDPTKLPPTIKERKEHRRKRARLGEAEEVFGSATDALPTLERLDYTVDLPYPTAPSFSAPSASHPPLLLRFEGAHVLSGLRALVSHGLTEGAQPGAKEEGVVSRTPGLPRWLGEAVEEGVNKVRVGRRRNGTVGRV
ncbi:hypothetical protein JCM10207_003556 [Rhodosporidiobolus poonsookiae]